MAESEIKNELKAIETIINVLRPLDKTTQQRVLQYAMKHLGLQAEQADQLPPALDRNIGAQVEQLTQRLQKKVVDIRTLRDQKQPSSDNEMAAIVAYYLSELAPEKSRKNTIGPGDIRTYFNQAGHPLPQRADVTLPNAKAAGYFESVGYGKYQLNPVGHNLVVHGLPRAKGESITTFPRKKRKKKKKAKSPKKKTAKKEG
ncbi:hypothetical protein ES703_43999 [subsurface metagenome]